MVKQEEQAGAKHSNVDAIGGETGFPLRECRVIFLGDGNAGKTSLIERITYNRFKEGSLSTRGVCESIWEADLDGVHTLFRIFDFGGQSIMHTIHRRFLTQNTIYVVVCENKEEDTPYHGPDRWLESLNACVPNCPIILAMNKADQYGRNTCNEMFLKKTAPMLRSILYVSAKAEPDETFGIKSLVHEIHQAMLDCISFSELKETWKSLETTLNERSENYIGQEQFLNLCQNCGIEDDTEQKEVLRWLIELGILYQSGTGTLSSGGEITLFNPVWLINGIDRVVLDSPDGGTIPHQTIQEVLTRRERHESGALLGVPSHLRYDGAATDYILRAMRDCEISRDIGNEQELIPLKMDKTPPDAVKGFPKDRSLHLRWRSTFLSKDLIHRLMIHEYPILKKDRAWLNGALFESEVEEYAILAEIDADEECLDLYVYGKENDLRVYARRFRQDILQMLRGSNIRAEELIGRFADNENRFVSLKDVLEQICQEPDREIIVPGTERFISPIELLQDIYLDADDMITQYESQMNRRKRTSGQQETRRKQESPDAKSEREKAFHVRILPQIILPSVVALMVLCLVFLHLTGRYEKAVEALESLIRLLGRQTGR